LPIVQKIYSLGEMSSTQAHDAGSLEQQSEHPLNGVAEAKKINSWT